MNFTKPAILIALLGITLTLSNCKKYDDGPLISLRSKKERVANNWDLTVYTTNGEDAMRFTNSDYLFCDNGGTVSFTIGARYTQYKWEFSESGIISTNETVSVTNIDKDLTEKYCYPNYTYSTLNGNSSGTWKFISNKEKLQLEIYNETWILDIKQLKEKSMHLQGKVGNDNVYMEFESN